LLTESAVHFLLCFLIRDRISGAFSFCVEGDGALVGAGTVIFLLLAFGLRPLFGAVLDEIPRFHSQSAGCLLMAAGCFFPPAWGWGMLILSGIGYALFLTGAGGESLAFARGYFSRSGILLSSGGLGAVLCGLSGGLPDLLLAFLALGGAVACFFFSEARKYPRRIRSFRHSVRKDFPAPVRLVMILFPLFAVSFTGALLPASNLGGGVLVAAPVCAAVGCAAGGLVCDRFGPRKATLFAFGLALPLLTVFTHISWLYCLGILVLHMPLTASLGASTAVLSTRPHFAFGLCSAAILLGSVPTLFFITVTSTVRLIAAGVLVLAGGVCYYLFTDHCKLFGFYGFYSRKGVER